jgi:glycerophosphoryl diester phosphodiesterase
MARIIFWIGRLAAAIAAALALVWLANASFWSRYSAPTTFLAHRGMAQTYSKDDLGRQDCTATRIYPPEHGRLENTLEGIEAAFAAGADVVEFDIHPTTDGKFAVFHDWTLECRTDGDGVTREQSMTYLKTLDIGYGYTADGGKTFPFRGKFVGAMPTLDEVLARFPDKRFLINIKSNDAGEGALLAARLRQLPAAQRALLSSYGGERPEAVLRAAFPDMRIMDKRQYRKCLVRYLKVGWTGRMPAACRNTLILVPMNFGFLLWGWPNRFVERMHAAGSEVYVIGPYEKGDAGSRGVDTLEEVARLPRDFPGGVWTNRIDRVAPAVKGSER